MSGAFVFRIDQIRLHLSIHIQQPQSSSPEPNPSCSWLRLRRPWRGRHAQQQAPLENLAVVHPLPLDAHVEPQEGVEEVAVPEDGDDALRPVCF
jgi:hypothetical protein